MSRRQRQREAERLRRLHLLAAVGVLPLAAVAVLRYAAARPVEQLRAGSAERPFLDSRLDPNTAPWWELTHLPGIGETRARAIVEHRARAATGHDDAVVFQRVEDLQAVKGIGPKTVARIAPYLVFPAEPSPTAPPCCSAG